MTTTSNFINPADYPFTAHLEADWTAVRREVEALPHDKFQPWPEKTLYENRWDVFVMHNQGRRLDKNCALCPETARIVEAVPGLVTAGFSWMSPGAHITPHHGYTDTVLRCHLGLIVPPDCALRVGGETQAWQEGRTLIFDDTIWHEAWNRSAAERVILLLDFEKSAQPAARREAAVSVAKVLDAAGRPAASATSRAHARV